jgi:hypothetical protein
MVDNLSWEGPSGYGDLQFVNGLSAAPNPATDHLDLQFTLPEADDFTFEVVTPQGEVQSLIGKNKFTSGLNTHRFDTHGLVPGMYILRAQGAKYSFVQKFVVGR